MDPICSTVPKCNHDCPVCKMSGNLPNIAGRFHIINATECQCNACKTIFDKSRFYKPVVFASALE